MDEVIIRGPNKFLERLRSRLWRGARMSISFDGGLLPFDYGDKLANTIRKGKFENSELVLTKILCRPVRGFIDVGANLGLYTLLASRNIKSDGYVVAFEPSPIEFRKLQWTIRRNKLVNVTAIRSAVSAEDGTGYLYQSTSGHGALNRVDRHATSDATWQQVSVPYIMLDSWRQQTSASNIDFLKIDIEGHELPALRGAQLLLEEEKPIVLIEMAEKRSSENSNPEAVWEFLKKIGYSWFDIVDGGRRLVELRDYTERANLLAVPSTIKNSDLQKLVMSLRK